MTLSDISITTAGVIESTIIYGIVHAIWTIIKLCTRWLEKQTRTEVGRIITTHVKNGHNTRFKHCVQETCATVPGTVTDLPVHWQTD